MRTSNPALSEKALSRTVVDDTVSPWTPAGPTGPVTADRETMTVGGAVSATAVLLVLLAAAGAVGWAATDVELGTVQLPGWLLPALLGALGIAIVTIFRPHWARFTAPVYAIVEGTVLGAISKLYELEYDGIVLQAAVGTMGVLAVMLFLHATGIIKVTERFRMGVVMATGGVMLMYVVSMVFRLFGSEVPFLHDTGPVGILVSLAIVAIAALNLVLDFDFVERAVAARAPKTTEWYAAFGLVLTLVWLYLELLRLLSKMRR